MKISNTLRSCKRGGYNNRRHQIITPCWLMSMIIVFSCAAIDECFSLSLSYGKNKMKSNTVTGGVSY